MKLKYKLIYMFFFDYLLKFQLYIYMYVILFVLYIVYQGYVLRTPIDLMKENGFKLAKERGRRYRTQTITDVDYADDISLLANTPTIA